MSTPIGMVALIESWKAIRGGPEEFWTCIENDERLTWNDFPEAVTSYVEDRLFSGCDLEVILRQEVAPLTVYGYSRIELTDKRLAEFGKDLAETLAEQLQEDEDLGDPDGRHDVLSDKGKEALAERFTAALVAERAAITPWTCEVTKTVHLEADELVALVRMESPSWFNVQLPPGGGNRSTKGAST